MESTLTTSPQDALRRARRVELVAVRLVNDAMVGGYLSSFKGRGTDFEELVLGQSSGHAAQIGGSC